MQVTKLKEEGVTEALLGMALSYYPGDQNLALWWTDERKDKALKRAGLLAHKQGGHSKFLESIQVWILVHACRSFWQEFDTYRVGVTKQSASTMHTLTKRYADVSDFEAGTDAAVISAFNHVLENNPGDITAIKNNLPEGFLQFRVVCTNYKALQNICYQRKGHRLKYWKTFIDALETQLDYPEWVLPREYVKTQSQEQVVPAAMHPDMLKSKKDLLRLIKRGSSIDFDTKFLIDALSVSESEEGDIEVGLCPDPLQ